MCYFKVCAFAQLRTGTSVAESRQRSRFVTEIAMSQAYPRSGACDSRATLADAIKHAVAANHEQSFSQLHVEVMYRSPAPNRYSRELRPVTGLAVVACAFNSLPGKKRVKLVSCSETILDREIKNAQIQGSSVVFAAMVGFFALTRSCLPLVFRMKIMTYRKTYNIQRDLMLEYLISARGMDG